jgi:hypothetical protein
MSGRPDGFPSTLGVIWGHRAPRLAPQVGVQRLARTEDRVCIWAGIYAETALTARAWRGAAG